MLGLRGVQPSCLQCLIAQPPQRIGVFIGRVDMKELVSFRLIGVPLTYFPGTTAPASKTAPESPPISLLIEFMPSESDNLDLNLILHSSTVM